MSTRTACDLVGLARARVYRARTARVYGPRPAPVPGLQPNALSVRERQEILAVLNSGEFVDKSLARAVSNAIGRRHDLAGEVVLVTAGGTREALDPVRYLGNRSSGMMGYALADAASSRGARVILISGPSSLHPPAHCELVHVTTAEEMRASVLERMSEATLVVKAAAVADYRPAAPADVLHPLAQYL